MITITNALLSLLKFPITLVIGTIVLVVFQELNTRYGGFVLGYTHF